LFGTPSLSHAYLLFLIAFAACSSGAARSGTWVAERERRGDTLMVRTLSGSVWGQPMTLIEELRIGVLDGPEEQMLGFVQAIAVDSSGGIYVFDGQVPALRHFDSAGTYVRTLGGKGAGPGEYQDIVLGLAVRRDGRLILHDPRNARLTLYRADGIVSDTWLVVSGSRLYTAQAMTVDTADHVYLKIVLGERQPDGPWPIGLLHLDQEGRIVDSLPAPPISGDPASDGGVFSARKLWGFSPFGYFVVGVNDHYAFEIRPPERPVVRVERRWEPVRLHPEEHAEYEAFREWTKKTQRRYLTSEPPPTPATKPAYRELAFGNDGRIWVRLHVSALKDSAEPSHPGPDRPPAINWREPVVWDVFEEDGTYLGEVRAPPRSFLSVFGREQVWGTREGEQGETYVVRFRMIPAGATRAQ